MNKMNFTMSALALVGLGGIIGFAIPVGPHYGVVATSYSEDTPEIPDGPTDQDAIFAATLTGIVPADRLPWARGVVAGFCQDMDNGATAAQALDAQLSPLTTDTEVVQATAAIGSGVGSYCSEHVGAMLDMAHEMHGDGVSA